MQRDVGSLKIYSSSPNKKRAFCGNYGTPLYSQRMDIPETIRLRFFDFCTLVFRHFDWCRV